MRITSLLKGVAEKGMAIGAILFATGFAYLLFLFIQWVNSGFRYLPLRGQNMLALTALVLGAQTVIYSFIFEFIKSMK